MIFTPTRTAWEEPASHMKSTRPTSCPLRNMKWLEVGLGYVRLHVSHSSMMAVLQSFSSLQVTISQLVQLVQLVCMSLAMLGMRGKHLI